MTGIAAALIPAVGWAQAATPDTPPATVGLEEVVVTAQKRSENVQKVPIAIEAFSARSLQAMQVTSTTDLNDFVPGLNITRANVASVPFLRGVGNFTATPGNEAAIATYVDDVYYASPAASTFSFNNVGRIEVLKGPQGTLFGRNAAGGVINIVTKDPSAEPHADLSAGYANYDTGTVNFYGSTPVAPGLAADLSVYGENQGEGWGRNLLTGGQAYLSHEFSVRSKWVFQPSSDWKFRLIADYDDTRNDISSALAVIPGTVNLGGIGHVGGFYDIDQNFPSLGEQRQWGVSLRADHEMNWATLSSITAYRRDDGIGNQDGEASPLALNAAHFNPRQATTTQELQLAAPSSSVVKWIGGFYFFSDTAGVDPINQSGTQYVSHPLSEQFLYSNQATTSYAGYGQATFPVYAATRLTLGLRYTDDDRSIVGRFFDVTGRQFNQASQAQSWPAMTYRASLDHDFTSNILGYISYNRGFKSGNFNVYNPAAAPVAPEFIDAYEIGVKSDLWQHRLRLNASIFDYSFQNLQVQETIAGGTVQLNAANATYRGLDVDATLAPTQNLTVTASMELLDAKYDSFPAAVYNFACVTPTIAAACATSVNGGGYFTAPGNAAGKQIPYAEKYNGTLAATYTLPTSKGDIAFTGSAAYHNGFWFDVQNTLAQPSYVMVDMSATWTSPNHKYDVKLWGKNLGGVKYYGQEQVNSLVADYTAEPPLTFGVTLGYHWF